MAGFFCLTDYRREPRNSALEAPLTPRGKADAAPEDPFVFGAALVVMSICAGESPCCWGGLRSQDKSRFFILWTPRESKARGKFDSFVFQSCFPGCTPDVWAASTHWGEKLKVLERKGVMNVFQKQGQPGAQLCSRAGILLSGFSPSVLCEEWMSSSPFIDHFNASHLSTQREKNLQDQLYRGW